MKFHFAEEPSAPKFNVTFQLKHKCQYFWRFYAWRQLKNTQHGFPIKTAIVEPDINLSEVEDANFKEEVRSCGHFLVKVELELARHKVFNYDFENLNAKIVDEKPDHIFKNLKWAVKVNVAFGFILEKMEDGVFKYLYAHKNKHPSGSIEVCVHQRRPSKVEENSRQSWSHRQV